MALLDWIELSDEEVTAEEEEEFPPQNVKEEFPPTKVKEEFPPTKVKEEFPPTVVKEEQDAHVHCHAAQLEVEPVDLTIEEDDVEGHRNAHGKGDAAQWAKTSHSQQFVAPHGQGEAAWTVVQRQEFLAAAKGMEEFLVTDDVGQETMQSGNQDFTAAVNCAKEATHSENAAEAGPSSFIEQGVVASDCGEEAMQPGKQDFAAAVDCGEEAMQPGKQDFAATVDCAEDR